MTTQINKDLIKEIYRGLKWLYNSEDEESNRMILHYYGEKKGKKILEDIDEEIKQFGP